jgi:hypothetical protein
MYPTCQYDSVSLCYVIFIRFVVGYDNHVNVIACLRLTNGLFLDIATIFIGLDSFEIPSEVCVGIRVVVSHINGIIVKWKLYFKLECIAIVSILEVLDVLSISIPTMSVPNNRVLA